MIDRDVIGNEIEQQLDSAAVELTTKHGQCCIAAKRLGNIRTDDGVRRAGNIVTSGGLRVASATPGAPMFAQLPNAHQPNMGKPGVLEKTELGMWNVRESEEVARAIR